MLQTISLPFTHSILFGSYFPEVALHVSVKGAPLTIFHVSSFASFTTHCAETSQGDTSYL